jgi:phage-related protein
MKPVRFVGDTLQAIRNFPVAAKNKAGYQLERVQRGLDPQDWKADKVPSAPVCGNFACVMKAGVSGDLPRDVARAIYVLHAFQKKTQHTARDDIELAARRFRQVKRSTGG